MSFPAYPEYKDSGVEWLGEVPEHWNVKRVRFVAQLNPPKSEVRSLPKDMEVSFIPMEAIGEDGSLQIMQTRPLGEVLYGYTYLRDGDVGVAKITPSFENGKAAVMEGLRNGLGFGTTELAVLRPHSTQVTSRYLYRVIQSEPFRDLGESEMYGAGGQKRAPDDFVRDFSIAWPSQPEQEGIASFLDHETARIDALIEEQKRLIELLKEKRQAVISHAVTKGLDPNVPMKDSGVEWLGEVPAHWKVLKLNMISVDKCDGPFGSALKSEHYTEEGVRVVRLQNIRKGAFDDEDAAYIGEDYYKRSIARSDVKAGDVLVAGLGDEKNSVGRACVAPKGLEPAMVKADCFRFRIDLRKAEAEFVAEQLSAGAEADAGILANGSTRSRIPLLTMSTRRIALPPIDEQRKISRHLKEVKTQLGAMLSEAIVSIELLEERRSALISAAVTGKIDVRDWQPPEGHAHTEAEATEDASA